MEPPPDSAAVRGPAPRRALPRRVAAVALIIGIAGTFFAWWGQPRLGPGSTVALGDGMTWANDGIEDTRMLVRGRSVGTVTARFSIHNDGHLPFTVHGLDPSGWAGNWLARQQVTFVRGFSDDRAAPAGQLTLHPGDEATVLWSLDMRCQPPLAEGAFLSIDTLRFRVSWWGIPTTRRLPLREPITFAGGATGQPLPGQECAHAGISRR